MIDIHTTLTDFRQTLTNHGTTDAVLQCFKNIINDYYARNRRSFFWREHIDPYYVVVSEIMLQQTQTKRVEEKFPSFIKRFPSFEELARASLHDVLNEWSGLGYNRRAISLHLIAQKIMNDYHGVLPSDPSLLDTFPGLGAATASSIVAFAFNKPTVFIETNIRSVFIHFFFHTLETVHDKQILPLIEKTLDIQKPRDWYYALMDYGVLIKTLYPNPSRKSKHYAVQSKFEGSNRQLRSMILKTILKHHTISHSDLLALIPAQKEIVEKNLSAMEKEGFFKKINSSYISDKHKS